MIALVYLRDVTPDGELWMCLYVLPQPEAVVRAAALSRTFARIYVVWHDAATGHLVFHLPPPPGGWRPPVL